MIELRWLYRQKEVESEDLVLRDGSPVMETVMERILQYRRVVMYVEVEHETGSKSDEPEVWSEWRDVPTEFDKTMFKE
jgi:hypothetical protein